MKILFTIATLAIVPLLYGCSSVEGDITCTLSAWNISCGVKPTNGQDLSAQGAKDEKPVKPFEESSSGSEETTP
jgi:hypothetical protein